MKQTSIRQSSSLIRSSSSSVVIGIRFFFPGVSIFSSVLWITTSYRVAKAYTEKVFRILEFKEKKSGFFVLERQECSEGRKKTRKSTLEKLFKQIGGVHFEKTIIKKKTFFVHFS